MRIHSASLGLYVPGHGLRSFVPAIFTIPPQPAGIGATVPNPNPANNTMTYTGQGGNVVTRTSQWIQTAPGQFQHVIGWSANGGPVVDQTFNWSAKAGANGQPGTVTRSNAVWTGPQGKTWGVPGSTTYTSGVHGVGDFVPARRGWWAAMYPGMSGYGGDDCGCGCGGSCGGGMGQISTAFSAMVSDLSAGNWSNAWTDFMTLLNEPVIGTVPLWMIAGGVVLVWALFFSGGAHSRYQRGRRASQAAARAYA